MRQLVIALLTAGYASLAAAGAPTSVFGIELGRPLALPECPSKVAAGVKLYDLAPESTCVQDAAPLQGYATPVRRVVFGRAESPSTVKNGRLFPLEQDGKVVGVHWLTAGVASQGEALEQLRAKFGAATSQSVRQVQTAGGGSFEAVTAIWSLPDLSVRFFGVGERITMGEVYVDLPAGAALRAAWNQHDATAERKL